MEPKPGIKTSEFWGKTVAQLVGIICIALAWTGTEVPPELQEKMIVGGMSLVGGVEAIYDVIRGVAKTKGGLR